MLPRKRPAVQQILGIESKIQEIWESNLKFTKFVAVDQLQHRICNFTERKKQKQNITTYVEIQILVQNKPLL